MFKSLIEFLNENIKAFDEYVVQKDNDTTDKAVFDHDKKIYMDGMKATVEAVKAEEEMIKDNYAAEFFEEVVQYLADELDYDFVKHVLDENFPELFEEE